MSNSTNTILSTTRPISIPHLQVPSLGFAKAVEALVLAHGDAFSFVYAAPFICRLRQPPAVSDQDLEGRDPSW